MPRRLLDRIQPDSIAEFRAAAQEREMDAISLEASGRRTAAIYLWGYAAEMVLKAAYFRAAGFAENQVIVMQNLRDALVPVKVPGKPASLHDLELWAAALVVLRSSPPTSAYRDHEFGRSVTENARRLYGLWRETLRYHKNVAYPHELAQAREAAEWLLVRSDDL